uniref:VASt domain-containing protein n=1 Tax=Macrostomum lignano TaxID=282301 RepID=A0A1I8FNF8_9PLAT
KVPDPTGVLRSQSSKLPQLSHPGPGAGHSCVQLRLRAEGCHLQPSDELLISGGGNRILDERKFVTVVIKSAYLARGLDHYVFTRLNLVLDRSARFAQPQPTTSTAGAPTQRTWLSKGAVASGFAQPEAGRPAMECVHGPGGPGRSWASPRTAPALETLTKVCQQQQQPHPQQPAFARLDGCASSSPVPPASPLEAACWGRGAPSPPLARWAGFLSDLTARQAQIDRALALRAAPPHAAVHLRPPPLRSRVQRQADLLIQRVSQLARDRLCLLETAAWRRGSWEAAGRARPKAAGGFTPMPVLQLTCITQEARALAADPAKQGEVYSCPVYFSPHQQPAAASQRSSRRFAATADAAIRSRATARRGAVGEVGAAGACRRPSGPIES